MPGVKKVIPIIRLSIWLSWLGCYCCSTNGLIAQDCKTWLTCKSDPTNSIVINWYTTNAGNSVVYYGLTQSLGTIDSTNESVNYHHVELSLQRGQTYYYQAITTGIDCSDVKHFKIHDGGSSTKFLMIGDTHHNDTLEMVINTILVRGHNSDVDALIHLGDLVHTGGSDSLWAGFFNAMDTLIGFMPIFPTIGNHEFEGGDDSVSHYRNYFDLPLNGDSSWYYYADFPNIRIISLCRATWYRLPRYSNDRVQYEWLYEKIQNCPKMIIIPIYHIPTADIRSWDLDTEAETIEWDNLFWNNGVRIVLNGHYHWHTRNQRDKVTYVNVGHAAHYWHNVNDYLPNQYNIFAQGNTARSGKGYNIIEINGRTITERAYDLSSSTPIDTIQIVIKQSSISN